MANGKEIAKATGPKFSSFMVLCVFFDKFFPQTRRKWMENCMKTVVTVFNPYVNISFHEYSLNGMRRNEAYDAIHSYIASMSAVDQAKNLRGEVVRRAKSVLLTVDDYEEVHDIYVGINVSWRVVKQTVRNTTNAESKEKRYYKLTFHKRYREQIASGYVNYVLEQGRATEAKRKQRKLYTNNPSRYYGTQWSQVIFEHPATFETLGMDPVEKKELMDELVAFTKAKEYYERIGRGWKRGYLLYGPPGTGKSTLVAAIANFIGYDIYDLELTAVASNNELRKLLTATTSKSILLIEDIDCSLNLTGQRTINKNDGKAFKKKIKKEHDEHEESTGEDDGIKSKVTLSGQLNFIDGLWSASSAERLIILTTNYIEKLDPALIRSGRMDRHIELSYCNYEAFKVLARNYLGITSHNLFRKIKNLLMEVDISPADVAEKLMPKTMKEDPEASLATLIKALETSAKTKDNLDKTTNTDNDEE